MTTSKTNIADVTSKDFYVVSCGHKIDLAKWLGDLIPGTAAYTRKVDQLVKNRTCTPCYVKGLNETSDQQMEQLEQKLNISSIPVKQYINVREPDLSEDTQKYLNRVLWIHRVRAYFLSEGNEAFKYPVLGKTEVPEPTFTVNVNAMLRLVKDVFEYGDWTALRAAVQKGEDIESYLINEIAARIVARKGSLSEEHLLCALDDEKQELAVALLKKHDREAIRRTINPSTSA